MSELWSDEELKAAVSSYLYMLSLERASIPFSVAAMSNYLIETTLSKRNEASVRYRMRNISYVMQRMRKPILKAFSPAPQVGSGVSKRIQEIINSNINAEWNLLALKREPYPELSNDVDLRLVFSKLDKLYEMVSHLKIETVGIGIGHNNPPSPIENVPFKCSEIEKVKKDINAIKLELGKQSPNSSLIIEKINRILNLGLKVAIWLGNRVTDFSESAAKAAGKAVGAAGGAVLVIELAGWGPHILDTAKTLITYIQNLG